jgi:Uma2 family endonuclease
LTVATAASIRNLQIPRPHQQRALPELHGVFIGTLGTGPFGPIGAGNVLALRRRYNERMPGSDDMNVGPSGNHADQGHKLTYDDFLLFPDDGLRHELIDGEHYVTPSPILRHQAISGRLHLAIGSWLRDRPVGQIFYAPLDVIFSRFDVVEPDLLYVSNERAPDLLSGKWVTGAPDLVIEIASPGTRRRDETIKRRLYEGSNVLEYWVVDPDTDVIRVYRRSGDRFERAVELSAEAGDVLITALLPGLEIPVADVFAATV